MSREERVKHPLVRVQEEAIHENCCGVKSPHKHSTWAGFETHLLSPSIRAHEKPCGETWSGEVHMAMSAIRYGEREFALVRAMTDKRVARHQRAVAREKLRARHVMRALKASGAAKEMKASFVTARFGGDPKAAKAARKGVSDARAAQTVNEMSIKYPRTAEDHALKTGNPYIRRNAKYVKNCKHKFKRITKEWKQCKLCSWCKPRLGADSYSLRLPPILEGRELPPLSEDQQWVNMRTTHTLAGLELSKVVRAQQVQWSFKTDGHIMRYSIDVRFKSGWKPAGVFLETQWYRLLPTLQRAGDKPKKLWRAIQKELGLTWWPPWQKHPRDLSLGERNELYRCGDCAFTQQPTGYCSRHRRRFKRLHKKRRR